MSVDVGSVPPWKRELMERKRRQDEEEKRKRSEEITQLSQMPAWKRDIIMKKQKTKNSIVFIGGNNISNRATEASPERLAKDTPKSPTVRVSSTNHVPESRSEFTFEETENIVDGVVKREHIIPIQQNPWLKSDLERRHIPRTSPKRLSDGGSFDEPEIDEQVPQSQQPQSVSVAVANHTSCLHADGRVPDPHNQSENDDVFGNDEEEVTYGRGFVHKLLRRFKHLSSREEQNALLAKSSSPKRAASSDNILECSNRSPNKMSPKGYYSSVSSSHNSLTSPLHHKAHSLENLTPKTKVANPHTSFLDNSANEFTTVDSTSMDICDNSHSEIHVGNGQDHSTSVNMLNEHDEEVQPKDILRQVKVEVKSAESRNGSTWDALPRPNIVSLTRGVFESISTRPLPSMDSNRKSTPEPHVAKPVMVRSPVTFPEQISLDQRNSLDTSVSSEEMNCVEESVGNIPVSINYNQSVLQPSVATKPNSRYFPNSSAGLPSNWESSKNIINKTNTGVRTRSEPDINANKGQPVKESSSPWQPEINTLRSSVSESRVVENLEGSSQPSNTVNGYLSMKEREKIEQLRSYPSARVNGSLYPDSQPSDSVYNKFHTEQVVPVDKHDKVHVPISREGSSATTKKPDLPDRAVRNTSSILPKETLEGIEDKKTSYNQLSQADSKSSHASGANRQNLNLNLSDLPQRKKATETSKPEIVPQPEPVAVQSNATSVAPKPKKAEKLKRSVPSGPGSLLIRPASNLMVGTVTDAKYLNLTKYDDVKVGEFEPAKKRPGYYDEDFEEYEDDVPVTNIDDIMSDDLGSPSEFSYSILTPREGDATQIKLRRKKYEFEGAGVVIQNKSNLSIGKPQKKVSMNIMNYT